MGASCDWSREKFTLDEEIVKTVYQTFKKMSDDGLVYRGNKIVSWCSKHQTSFSDLEIKDEERTEPYYYLKYGPFTISTSRPESKFGDKYVVMHPDDKRYSEYIDGQKFTVEWINGPVETTVIKDEAVDMEFGTGVMTITPWHDAIDFGIAERHKLDKEQIIDFRGKLLPIAGEFVGTKAVDARSAIVERLKAKGLVEKIDSEYKHSVRVCYKCENTIEPQIRDQWFVKMEPLAKLAMKPVREKKITFIPKHTEKVFFHWMKNAIDWNISRQIVWGIRIPAWFRFKGELAHLNKLDLEDVGMETSRVHDGEIYPSPLTFREDLAKVEEFIGLEKPKGEGWIQDPDVFDTWFSSGQWPLVTLGYPDHKDFKTFYPTDMMETGADLVFKWVPRMIIFGMYLAKKIPFRTVYFHGMVNDAQNRKMSKSKGNVVSPIEIGEKYGTDALRMALVVGNPPGSSIPLSEDKIRAYKNFATKIWNIARFVLMNKPQINADQDADKRRKIGDNPLRNLHLSAITKEDKKNLKELAEIKKEITKHIEKFEFHLAAEKIYHYVWHTFADKIVESYKPRLRQASAVTKVLSNKSDGQARLRPTKEGQQLSANDTAAAYSTLEEIFTESLKMLHPFMPFITEELYGKFQPDKMLMIEPW